MMSKYHRASDAVRTTRYHAAFRLLADGLRDEFARRYREAWSADRAIRQRSRSPLPSGTYYEAALEDHRLAEEAKGPWRELLAWAEAQPGLAEQFPKEMESLRGNAAHVPPPDAADFEGYLDEDAAEFYLDNGDLDRLLPLLDANGVPYRTHGFPTGKEVMTIDFDGPDGPWVVEPGKPLSYWRETQEWVESAAERPHEFYAERDKSAEFWREVGPGSCLYHATNEDNVDSILASGLKARSDTRGLSNTDIGPAVFAVSSEGADAASQAYGDAVIRIDLWAMKADGYTPEVAGETPLEEAALKESLARAIDYDAYEAEREGDYMEDTVAILGGVPPKYLSLDEGTRNVGL